MGRGYPRDKRRESHPMTPDPHDHTSKRQWESAAQKWRESLREWYPSAWNHQAFATLRTACRVDVTLNSPLCISVPPALTTYFPFFYRPLWAVSPLLACYHVWQAILKQVPPLDVDFWLMTYDVFFCK